MARKIPINGPDRPAESASQTEPVEFRVVDRRHFSDPDRVHTPEPGGERPRYPSYVEELQSRMLETERRFEARRKQFDEEVSRLRVRLEGEFARRLEQDKGGMLLPLLEVLDNLERTLASASNGASQESLVEGVRMTAGLFHSRLKALGIEPVTALDQPFDPNVSQAIGTVEVSDSALDGVVVEELQRGYKIGEQLLRPAQVRVGKLI